MRLEKAVMVVVVVVVSALGCELGVQSTGAEVSRPSPLCRVNVLADLM